MRSGVIIEARRVRANHMRIIISLLCCILLYESRITYIDRRKKYVVTLNTETKNWLNHPIDGVRCTQNWYKLIIYYCYFIPADACMSKYFSNGLKVFMGYDRNNYYQKNNKRRRKIELLLLRCLQYLLREQKRVLFWLCVSTKIWIYIYISHNIGMERFRPLKYFHCTHAWFILCIILLMIIALAFVYSSCILFVLLKKPLVRASICLMKLK